MDLATIQGACSAVTEDGRIHTWKAGEPGMNSAMLGTGVVDIEGGIFTFLALTTDGEIYAWNGLDPSRHGTPLPSATRKAPSSVFATAG